MRHFVPRDTVCRRFVCCVTCAGVGTTLAVCSQQTGIWNLELGPWCHVGLCIDSLEIAQNHDSLKLKFEHIYVLHNVGERNRRKWRW